MPKFEVEIEGGTFSVDGADEDEALQSVLDALSYTISLVDESEDDEDDDDGEDEDEGEESEDDED